MSTPARPVRHLHLGLIENGRLVREHVLPPQRCAVVGESADATFSLPGPRRLLFCTTESGWELQLQDDLDGKVVRDGKPRTLREVRSSPGLSPRGSQVALGLSGTERGALHVSPTHTVLFRFIDPPPVALAPDYRPPLLDDDDPVFLGFLGIATAAAAAFMVVVANAPVTTGDAEVVLAQLQERVVLTMPPPTEAIEVEPEEAEEAPTLPVTRPTVRRPAPEPPPEPDTVASGEPTTPEDSVRRRSRLLRDPSAFAGIAGRIGGTSSTELDDALRDLHSERVASADGNALRRGTGGTGDEDIDDSFIIGGGTVASGTKRGPQTQITGRVTVPDDVEPEVGDRDLISSVIESNFPSFTYCYEKELKQQPGLGGRMELEFFVADGAVVDVAVVVDGVGSPSFADCLEQRAFRWNFRGIPEAEFVYPFVFRAR